MQVQDKKVCNTAKLYRDYGLGNDGQQVKSNIEMGIVPALNLLISTESTESIERLNPHNMYNKLYERKDVTLFTCNFLVTDFHDRRPPIWVKER